MLQIDENLDRLYTRFGTSSPKWELSTDSTALKVYTENGLELLHAFNLTDAQYARLTQLTGVTQSVLLELYVDEELLPVIVVGRKLSRTTWGGVLAYHTNTVEVANQLSKGLSFAEQIVSEANSFIVVLDPDLKICRFNKLCEEMSGMKEEDLLGRSCHELFMLPAEWQDSKDQLNSFFKNDTSYEVIRKVQSKSGILTVLWRNKFVVDDNTGKRYLVCSGLDITEEEKAKRQLEILANTDKLTGLPNRHNIMKELKARTESDVPFSMLFVDLDNFKKVNDCYGHDSGDDLLIHVSKLFKDNLPKEGFVGRLGGDEFVVLLNNEDVDSYISKLYSNLSVAIRLGFAEVFTNCSIGIAKYPDDDIAPVELLRKADTAMYAAKDKGKHTVMYFDMAMNEKVAEYVWLDCNFRQGLKNGELVVFYQPKLDLNTQEIVSLEALVRWKHAEKGFISPMSFIPYAEESGLIHVVGEEVLRQSALELKILRDSGLDIGITVNLSPKQLNHPDLVASYSKACLDAGLEVGALDLEITESCVADDPVKAISIMAELKALGATIYMDDFGTGYSSLSQLANLPVDILKMDRSFIKDISESTPKTHKSLTLVKAITAVAKEFGMKIVAEGVETLYQAEFLKSLNIDYAQGYYFAKPMDSEFLHVWLGKRQKAA